MTWKCRGVITAVCDACGNVFHGEHIAELFADGFVAEIRAKAFREAIEAVQNLSKTTEPTHDETLKTCANERT